MSPSRTTAVASFVWLGLTACVCASSTEDGFIIKDRSFDHMWGTKADMPGARSDMTATTVGDAIYLIGGCGKDQEWVEDPEWPEYKCGSGAATAIVNSTIRYLPLEDKFDSNWPDAPHGRYRHAAAGVGNKIFLFGGTDGSGNIVAEVDVLDISSRTWSTLPNPMPSSTTDLSSFVHAGKIYLLGGYSADWVAKATTQIFDPAANTWSVGASMVAGRGDSASVVIGDKAYALGGFTHANNFKFPLAGLEMLDLALPGASWVESAPMAVARGDKAAATLNGVLHVAGGESKDSQEHSMALRDVEAYDPDTNMWYFGGDIPTERFRFTAAAHGQTMFLFGGQGYLKGDRATVGSKYPVLSTVEAYTETVTVAEVSGSPSLIDQMARSIAITFIAVVSSF